MADISKEADIPGDGAWIEVSAVGALEMADGATYSLGVSAAYQNASVIWAVTDAADPPPAVRGHPWDENPGWPRFSTMQWTKLAGAHLWMKATKQVTVIATLIRPA